MTLLGCIWIYSLKTVAYLINFILLYPIWLNCHWFESMDESYIPQNSWAVITYPWPNIRLLNTSRPRQNGCHFTDDRFKCIFLRENVLILITISLKFVPRGPINNIPSLVQIMAWRCPGDKPLTEPVMVSLLTHICVTRPQWVKKKSNLS